MAFPDNLGNHELLHMAEILPATSWHYACKLQRTWVKSTRPTTTILWFQDWLKHELLAFEYPCNKLYDIHHTYSRLAVAPGPPSRKQNTSYLVLTNGRRVRFLPIYSRLAVDGKETLLVNLHQLVINNLCLWLKTIQLWPWAACKFPFTEVCKALEIT